MTGASPSSSSTTASVWRYFARVVGARSGCDRNASIAAARSTPDAAARRSAGRLLAVVTSAVLQPDLLAHQAPRRATSQETCRLRARARWRVAATGPGPRAPRRLGQSTSRGMGPSLRRRRRRPTRPQIAVVEKERSAPARIRDGPALQSSHRAGRWASARELDPARASQRTARHPQALSAGSRSNVPHGPGNGKRAGAGATRYGEVDASGAVVDAPVARGATDGGGTEEGGSGYGSAGDSRSRRRRRAHARASRSGREERPSPGRAEGLTREQLPTKGPDARRSRSTRPAAPRSAVSVACNSGASPARRLPSRQSPARPPHQPGRLTTVRTPRPQSAQLRHARTAQRRPTCAARRRPSRSRHGLPSGLPQWAARMIVAQLGRKLATNP